MALYYPGTTITFLDPRGKTSTKTKDKTSDTKNNRSRKGSHRSRRPPRPPLIREILI